MCLISKTKIPAMALKDIHAFKVIKVCDSQHWIAPYVGTIHKYNEILENNISNIDCSIQYFGDEYLISKGYFHSILSKIKAFTLLSHVKTLHNKYSSFRVVTVTISKGSLYYVENESDEICSNKIIVNN